MSIVFTNQGASAAPDFSISTDQSNYTGSVWTPPTAGVIAACVATRIANPGNTPTLQGNGISYTQVANLSVDPGASHRLTWFLGDAAGSSAGVPVVDYAGQTQLMCAISFISAEGVDISGGLEAAVVQTSSVSGSSTGGTLSFLAAGHADNRPLAAWFHQANEVTGPDGGWTEADDFSGSGPTRGFETQYKTDGMADNASTWVTSSPFVGLGFELKAEIAAGGQPAVKRMGGVPHVHSNSSQGGRTW